MLYLARVTTSGELNREFAQRFIPANITHCIMIFPRSRNCTQSSYLCRYDLLFQLMLILRAQTGQIRN